jgi:ABC-2 type transport system ATP-binding protein
MSPENATPAAAFELRGVSLRYPRSKSPALNNVSLKVPEGAICGLFGRNAAGKTSMMSLLAGFRRPTQGEVLVFGEDPYESPTAAAKTAFIFTGAANSATESTMAAYKVRDILRFAETLRPGWDEEFAAHLLGRFDINPKKTVSKLSLGQRAALRCVLGLASHAPLTIFDEAYLGMDAIYRRIFVDELLASYVRSPRTILFSTHYIAEMERLFSEAIIIDAGAVLSHADADALRASCPTASSLQDVFIRLTIKEGETYEPASFN